MFISLSLALSSHKYINTHKHLAAYLNAAYLKKKKLVWLAKRSPLFASFLTQSNTPSSMPRFRQKKLAETKHNVLLP